ncbi:MAG: molybdopterin-dependent oxidoreductase [Alphaproteobacteria bacterium]|jgi:hypothetical protein|nr:molybdopterin-dependent oxidoreductase [Alphaproteobacteria bacterium]
MIRKLLLGLMLAFVPVAMAAAQDLAKPTGPVILEIRGNISRTNDAGAAKFDLAMLQALGAETIATATPWTEGHTKFEGIAGAKLLAAVGAKGTKVVAAAINDYKAEVPIEDLTEKGAFLAFSADGKRLTVRDKGPLWLLYPFDAKPDLKTEVYFGRSVWQIKSLEIK